jgi:branched-chain amino acid transport system substrate-binding protein
MHEKESYMKKLTKIISTVIALFLIIGCSDNKKSPIIRIGLAGPLTGEQAAIGQDMYHGSQMAVDEWNEKGGVLGKKIELEALDDKADNKEAVSIAHEFTSDPLLLAVIGHLNSGCSIPASKVYHQEKILEVTPCSTNPELTLQGWPEIFRFCTTDAVQGPFGADMAIQKLGKKRFAILHDKSQYGQGLAEQFKATAEKDGATILEFEGITKGDKDFTAILTKIKGLNPDILYFGGMYPEGGLIAKQAKDLGVKSILMGGDGIFDKQFIILGGPATEGAYITFLAPPWEKTPQAQTFVSKFKEKFKADVGPYAPFAYDAANCLLEAIQRTNSTDRAAIIKEFAATKDYKGVVGVTNFDEHGDSTNKIMYLYVVKDGKFELYQ